MSREKELKAWLVEHAKEHMNPLTCVVNVHSLIAEATKVLKVQYNTKALYALAVRVAVTTEVECMIAKK